MKDVHCPAAIATALRHPSRRSFVTASAACALGTLLHQPLFAQQALPVGRRRKVDSIDWYYELRGQGPTVVLIPSGEGDCGSFAKVADLLAARFRVLTFDMPGFSRSGDPPDFDHYTWSRAADEVAALVQALELAPATFYGCSSGGNFVLELATRHAGLVRRAIVHEVAAPPPVDGVRPSGPPPDPASNPIVRLTTLTDAQIVAECKDLFRNVMNEDPAAWDALGAAYHQRLERNYVTWVRRYIRPGPPPPTVQQLRGRQIVWSVGGLSATVATMDNIRAALAAGLPITLLNSRHFPQVSIPAALAEHIAKAAA